MTRFLHWCGIVCGLSAVEIKSMVCMPSSPSSFHGFCHRIGPMPTCSAESRKYISQCFKSKAGFPMRGIYIFSSEPLLFQHGFPDIGQQTKHLTAMVHWSGWDIAATAFAQVHRHLFGVELETLSVSQVALLAAMIRSPDGYDPACHPKRALEARNRFLRKMNEASLLSDSELEQAIVTRLWPSHRSASRLTKLNAMPASHNDGGTGRSA